MNWQLSHRADPNEVWMQWWKSTIREVVSTLRESHQQDPSAPTLCGACDDHEGLPGAKWPCQYERLARKLEQLL